MSKRLTEYEVREINADGDAVDVNHYDTEAEAKIDATSRTLPEGEVVAVVVEKCSGPYDEDMGRTKAPTYTTLATYGDRDALTAGGWIESAALRSQAGSRS